MVETGRELSAVKNVLPYGRFRHWLESEVGLPITTAERFITVADRLANKIDSLSTLSPDALYALAAPSTPNSVIDDVIAGQIEPTPKAIRAEISRRKGTAGTPRHPRSAAWQAFDGLINRYPGIDARELSAELLVRLAYICPCPTWEHIEDDLASYEPTAQRDVRKGLKKLADSLVEWAGLEE
jgi:hypothetical protein